MHEKCLALMMWRNIHKLLLLFCLLIIFGLQQELIHRSSHLCFSSCLSRFTWTSVNCSQSKFRILSQHVSRPLKQRNNLKHLQSVSLSFGVKKYILNHLFRTKQPEMSVSPQSVESHHTETLSSKSNTSPRFLCRSVNYKGLPYFEFLSVRRLWHDRIRLWATKKYILSFNVSSYKTLQPPGVLN